MRFTLVYLTAALFAVAATAAPANRLLARGEGGGCAANSEPHCCQTISDTKNSTIASTLSKYGVPPEMAKGPVGLACKFAFFFRGCAFFTLRIGPRDGRVAATLSIFIHRHVLLLLEFRSRALAAGTPISTIVTLGQRCNANTVCCSNNNYVCWPALYRIHVLSFHLLTSD